MGNKISLQKRGIGIAMFILLVLGVSNNLKAQQYIQQVFDYNNTNEFGNDIIRNSDNSYFLLGNLKEDTANYSKMFLIKTDSLFNPLWSKIYYSDSVFNSGQNIIPISDSTYILISLSGYSNSKSTQRLIKIDAVGDTIWTNEIGNFGYFTFLNTLGIKGDTLFLYGSAFNRSIDNNTLGLIVGINTNTGQIVKSETYELSSHLNTYFAKAGKKIIGGLTRYYILGFSLIDTVDFKTSCFILELDSNFSNEKVVIISDSAATYQNVPNIDVSDVSNKILVGFTTNDHIGSGPKYCFAEFDDQLNFKWAKKYYGVQGNLDFYDAKYSEIKNTIITTNGSNIYILDSVGNIVKNSDAYTNQLLISPYSHFEKSIIDSNRIIWFGSIRVIRWV